MSQRDQEPEGNEQRAAELESEARSYESAADRAAGTGNQRRVRQLRQSARASRRLAAEARRHAPDLLARLKERTDAARRRPRSTTRDARREQRQAAEQEWLVRRWLRRLREQ